MGLLDRARRLDDRVLGSSDSPRGFLVNLLLGLHPRLRPLWLLIAAGAVAILAVAVVRRDAELAVNAVLTGPVAFGWAWTCRRLPPGPR